MKTLIAYVVTVTDCSSINLNLYATQEVIIRRIIHHGTCEKYFKYLLS